MIKNCFNAPVTDLSWSTNAALLLACSLDGSLCCFQFDDGEIGTPISDADQSKLLQAKVSKAMDAFQAIERCILMPRNLCTAE